MSSTVGKALEMLNLFSLSRPEIGLSEFARLAQQDKATTHRMLGVLARHGFVEQNVASKLYRLGAANLRLARTREASFPVAAIIQPVLQDLSELTGETVHASLVAGHALATIGMVASRKAIHVTMGPGDSLPFHATASGIAILAYLPDEQVEAILQNRLSPYTDHTPIHLPDVMKLVQQARMRGYAVAEQSYESDVTGIAAPLFSADAMAFGAIAVATPAHRMNREVRASTIRAVLDAATLVTRRTGSEPPQHFMLNLRKVAA
jgi:IclR family transcriptional regulator, acetate operon repressor